MSIKSRDVTFVVSLMIIVVGGLWFAAKHYDFRRFYPSKERAAAPEDGHAAFIRAFDTALEDFLETIGTQARDYKAQRKVLDDLIKPANLKSAVFIDENYKLSQSLIPSLRSKINALIKTFDSQEDRILTLISTQQDSVRLQAEEKWQALKDRQITLYADYFLIEDRILSAHEELLALYFRERNAVHADTEAGKMVFENPVNQEKEREILEKMQDLYARQAAILG